jgi:hypothetical protein
MELFVRAFGKYTVKFHVTMLTRMRALPRLFNHLITIIIFRFHNPIEPIKSIPEFTSNDNIEFTVFYIIIYIINYFFK